MSVTAQERKRYMQQIKKRLFYPKKQKRRFLLSFSDSMEAYLEDHPEADFTQLQTEMGTPEEIANEFLANESAETIKKRMRIAKWIKIGVVLALCTLLFMVAFELLDAHSAFHGHFEESITEYPVEENLIEE